MSSGVVFVALSLLSLATMVQASLLDVGLVVANLLTLGAAVGLHALQKDRYGYLGRGGFVIAVVGILTNTIGTAAHVLGVSTFEVLAFPVGLVGLVVGLGLMGIATFRARVLPRWCGVALVFALPLTALAGIALGPVSEFGNYSGGFVAGVVFLAVGYVLWSETDETTVEVTSESKAEVG